MGRSLAERVAALPAEEREEALAGLALDELRWDWSFWARPEQLGATQDHETHITALITGRGAGKTRTGAEFTRDRAREGGHVRMALVARTAADVRDVMINGESGILAVHPPSEQPEYIASRRLLQWPNGAQALTFSSVESDQLRGPQQHYAWGDELATWNHVPGIDGLTAWQNLEIGTRLGEYPQILVSTTPKRVPVIYELLDRVGRDVQVVGGRTQDNVGNLSQSYLDFLVGMYEGTRLGAQELEGILLEDLEGALFQQEWIDKSRVNPLVDASRLPLRVVAVDPSVAEQPKDECGIVVLGSTAERELFRRRVYVLEDASLKGSPSEWTRVVVEKARAWAAPVLCEINQGQALVQMAINAVDQSISVFGVNARKGKATRAEPVALLYERGRVHHVGWHPDLEAQMTSWIPGEVKKSPDRMDALVWGATALAISPPKGMPTGRRGRVWRAGVRVPQLREQLAHLNDPARTRRAS